LVATVALQTTTKTWLGRRLDLQETPAALGDAVDLGAP
jgi:hypothetical protein